MKTNKEKVFDFIVEYSKRFKTINDETPKLDTQFLSEKLEMRRSNLSSILNQLVDERKIEKTKGRPVLYYLSTDQEVQIENQVFDSLIGQDLSLKDTIQFTKSAIAYPMRIPRILFTGQKGIGVRTLAEKIYEYVCLQRILKKDSNFKIVDCLDYNEKQISEKLIGKENIFLENCSELIKIWGEIQILILYLLFILMKTSINWITYEITLILWSISLPWITEISRKDSSLLKNSFKMNQII